MSHIWGKWVNLPKKDGIPLLKLFGVEFAIWVHFGEQETSSLPWCQREKGIGWGPGKKKWEGKRQNSVQLKIWVKNLSAHVHPQPFHSLPPSHTYTHRYAHQTDTHTHSHTPSILTYTRTQCIHKHTHIHNIHMHTVSGMHRCQAGQAPGAGVGFPGFDNREARRWLVEPETRKGGLMRRWKSWGAPWFTWADGSVWCFTWTLMSKYCFRGRMGPPPRGCGTLLWGHQVWRRCFWSSQQPLAGSLI